MPQKCLCSGPFQTFTCVSLHQAVDPYLLSNNLLYNKPGYISVSLSRENCFSKGSGDLCCMVRSTGGNSELVICIWKWKKRKWSHSVVSDYLRPMDCSLPGSSVHGIFQAVVLEWIAISFSRGSSQPRDQTPVSRIVDRRFTVWATRKVDLHLKYWSTCGTVLLTPRLVSELSWMTGHAEVWFVWENPTHLVSEMLGVWVEK